MSDSCLFSSGIKKIRQSICIFRLSIFVKGTVQNKLAHSYSKGNAEGDKLSQGTRLHRKTGWAAASREEAEGRQKEQHRALDLDRTQQELQATRGTLSGLTQTQCGKRH